MVELTTSTLFSWPVKDICYIHEQLCYHSTSKSDCAFNGNQSFLDVHLQENGKSKGPFIAKKQVQAICS
uniref:Ovule protein n=1 Tax=Romanomermis culicivorax TaxID=13658 RepID=A0A915KSD7_ROMCU